MPEEEEEEDHQAVQVEVAQVRSHLFVFCLMLTFTLGSENSDNAALYVPAATVMTLVSVLSAGLLSVLSGVI